jgi:hypothetical protein
VFDGLFVESNKSSGVDLHSGDDFFITLLKSDN